MRVHSYLLVFLAAGLTGAHSAEQIDLPTCIAGDGKTPVPRWEVAATLSEAGEGTDKPFAYSVSYPPPAYHGFMGHLRVQLAELDELSCRAKSDQLKEATYQSGEPVPIVVSWLFDDNGPLKDMRAIEIYELPEFKQDGCWLDGVYQFVALEHDDTKPTEYTLNLVPVADVQKAGSFCRPIQEG
ncbi:hypothetical protein PsAD2_00575 [Pseudovibrio axinellae]|uniref:Ig-like domain-containing protein n=1 Tax=Pseudovibrio axinellae TaxID=989403 RepID=A0A161VB22_9HYPH|nr:hypothetical protein [Pseudovibrio axinellae]KZL21284.1 hypothetical protein PsAD2_00575 [Pseudovibrio axinellae]SEQ94734.1 hypothetical protein SAMN05421798_105198 [Pseudovibrio axinellae]